MGENGQEREFMRSSSHVSIDMPDDDISIEELAYFILAYDGTTVSFGVDCKIPKNLHTEYKRYEPTTVSIGPYSRRLQEYPYVISTSLKKLYMCSLLGLSELEQEQTACLLPIVKAMKEKESDFKFSYGLHNKEIQTLDSNECVKMMTLDGCFILELLYKFKEYKDGSMNEAYKSTDPIFSYTWTLRHIQRDLLLLENQFPFLVLKSLFELTRDRKHNDSLIELVVHFLDPEIQTYKITGNDDVTSKHLLDVVRNHLIGESAKMVSVGSYPNWKLTQCCAAELNKAGVVFKKNEKAKSLLDITFDDKKGVLEIPPFFFGEGMLVCLQNLIALEQSSRDYKSHIISYVIFLDTLIKSKDDVNLLRSKGIINGSLKKDEEMASSVNGLYSRAIVDNYYYDALYQRVNDFCERDKQKRKARRQQWSIELFREYFSTPWRVCSIIIAGLVVILTLLQTIFTAIGTF